MPIQNAGLPPFLQSVVLVEQGQCGAAERYGVASARTVVGSQVPYCYSQLRRQRQSVVADRECEPVTPFAVIFERLVWRLDGYRERLRVGPELDGNVKVRVRTTIMSI